MIPSAWKPVIYAWTLRAVVGQISADLPAVPPELPKEENVRAAYEGLIEHMGVLSRLETPWPEMTATSVHWRGSGLVEALQPEAQNAPEAIKLLMLNIRRFLPDALQRRLGQHFSSIVEGRNSLTHIASTHRTPGFANIVDEWKEHSYIVNTLMGVTQLIFAQYSEELTASDSVKVRPWETLCWDLPFDN